ncbi:hypothetical protein H8G76_18500, partial [Bacillus pumilus]|nr:hypothetical protein [Bacillus pumilus]
MCIRDSVITDEETIDLKEGLKRTLPDYMIPSWIIKLDQPVSYTHLTLPTKLSGCRW